MLKTKIKEKNFNIGRYTEYVKNLLISWYNFDDKIPFKLSKEDIKYCMKHFGTNKLKIIYYFLKKGNMGSSEQKQSKKSKNKNKK